jgi:hypothetical protein
MVQIVSEFEFCIIDKYIDKSEKDRSQLSYIILNALLRVFHANS